MKKFKTWQPTEHETWQRLSQRQLPNLQNKASQIWLDGFSQLNLTKKTVPDFDQVSKKLNGLTSWQLTPTSQVFADGETWFQTLKQQRVLISDYIRPLDSLDYTPLPDVFHDAFGHLPFFSNQQFCRIVTTFTKRILQAPSKKRAQLGRIWWYSIEFGLIREKGELRALGAGLTSSFGEINRVFSGKTKVKPFKPDIVAQTENSPHQFHETLFVLESLDELERIAQTWSTQI